MAVPWSASAQRGCRRRRTRRCQRQTPPRARPFWRVPPATSTAQAAAPATSTASLETLLACPCHRQTLPYLRVRLSYWRVRLLFPPPFRLVTLPFRPANHSREATTMSCPPRRLFQCSLVLHAQLFLAQPCQSCHSAHCQLLAVSESTSRMPGPSLAASGVRPCAKAMRAHQNRLFHREVFLSLVVPDPVPGPVPVPPSATVREPLQPSRAPAFIKPCGMRNV